MDSCNYCGSQNSDVIYPCDGCGVEICSDCFSYSEDYDSLLCNECKNREDELNKDREF